jgi:hypothetical protein
MLQQMPSSSLSRSIDVNISVSFVHAGVDEVTAFFFLLIF